jgi:acetyl esterase/lipase
VRIKFGVWVCIFTLLGTSVGCQSVAVTLARHMSEFDFEAPPADMEVVRDIVFAETPQGPLDMNLYTPKVRPTEKLPLIVWVYGGGWFVGNKHQIQIARAYNLTRRGYAVAAISYRLSPVAPNPAQIHDVKASVRYLRAHADELGIDAERIGIWGASAGGHLVSLMGVTNGNEKMEGDVGGEALRGHSSDVAAVVNYFGVSDLMNAHVDGGSEEPSFMVESFLGGPFDENREAAMEASPVTWVAANSAPMLHVHGTEDPIVAIHQSVRLHDALQTAGVESTLRKVQGGGHGTGGDFDSDVLIEEVGDFFDRHLKR